MLAQAATKAGVAPYRPRHKNPDGFESAPSAGRITLVEAFLRVHLSEGREIARSRKLARGSGKRGLRASLSANELAQGQRPSALSLLRAADAFDTPRRGLL
jgi:hypothetical protein